MNTYVRVFVHAGKRKERILEVASSTYEIHVREKAERGEANARVREMLALVLGVRVEDVRMVKGARSPHKTYLLINHHLV